MNPIQHLMKVAPEATLFLLGALIVALSLSAAFFFCAGRVWQATLDRRRRRAANAILREFQTGRAGV